METVLHIEENVHDVLGVSGVGVVSIRIDLDVHARSGLENVIS